MDSQDRREPFEPKLNQSYAHDDPITGYRDKVGDENIRRKLGVFSSITQGAEALGTNRGIAFIAGTALVVYVDDDSAMSVALS